MTSGSVRLYPWGWAPLGMYWAVAAGHMGYGWSGGVMVPAEMRYGGRGGRKKWGFGGTVFAFLLNKSAKLVTTLLIGGCHLVSVSKPGPLDL
jgi:hypothetical protein